MQAALGGHVYNTKTLGLRHVPATRRFATGTYDIGTHGPRSHLRWTVEDIDTTDPVAADLSIERNADYIVTVANPDPTLWGVVEPPDLQSELFDELELHVTVPTSFLPPSRNASAIAGTRNWTRRNGWSIRGRSWCLWGRGSATRGYAVLWRR